MFLLEWDFPCTPGYDRELESAYRDPPHGFLLGFEDLKHSQDALSIKTQVLIRINNNKKFAIFLPIAYFFLVSCDKA